MISNESGLKIKLKVSTVDIQIKLSGLRISNSKVFSSDPVLSLVMYEQWSDSLAARCLTLNSYLIDRQLLLGFCPRVSVNEKTLNF